MIKHLLAFSFSILLFSISYSQNTEWYEKYRQIEKDYPKTVNWGQETARSFFYLYADSYDMETREDTALFIFGTYHGLINIRIAMLDTSQPYEGQDLILNLFKSDSNYIELYDYYHKSDFYFTYSCIVYDYGNEFNGEFVDNVYLYEVENDSTSLKKLDCTPKEAEKFRKKTLRLAKRTYLKIWDLESYDIEINFKTVLFPRRIVGYGFDIMMNRERYFGIIIH